MVDWEKVDRFTQWLSDTVRAALGLEVQKDQFQGLIHTNDDRERTVLTERDIHFQEYLELLYQYGGDEWKICHDWAEGLRHLAISKDGERATNFIQAKKKEEPAPVTGITITNQPTAEKQEKKGLLKR